MAACRCGCGKRPVCRVIRYRAGGTGSACHAEGRGFESLQPLRKSPAFASLFRAPSRLVRLRRRVNERVSRPKTLEAVRPECAESRIATGLSRRLELLTFCRRRRSRVRATVPAPERPRSNCLPLVLPGRPSGGAAAPETGLVRCSLRGERSGSTRDRLDHNQGPADAVAPIWLCRAKSARLDQASFAQIGTTVGTTARWAARPATAPRSPNATPGRAGCVFRSLPGPS
jgi:hypothetical protein